MRTDAIELVTQYKDGKDILEHTQKIYARCGNVNRSEFYASYGVGLRTSYMFQMHPAEYKLGNVVVGDKTYKATHVRYKGDTYEIVRAYEVDRFTMEITVK